jgi:glyoxylase-like metal-dependent hydrolase (beta-lactamase superfamily II)
MQLNPKAGSNPFAPRTYGELQKISGRVYLYRNITNSTILVGEDAAAVIDTQVNLPTARRVLECVRQVTSKPLRWVINTHYHWDHTNGNALFAAAGATVVSSAKTRAFMVDRAPRQKAFLAGRGFELGEDPELPSVTFEDEYTLDLGGLPVRAFFAGEAESDDASAVYLPTERVLISGDTIMTGSFPIFGQPVWDEGLQGDGRWEATIGRLLALDPEHILPGHGPLAGQAEARQLLSIERYFVEEVSKCVQRRLGPLETLQAIEPNLPDWITAMPVVWGNPRYAILRVYRGLTRRPSDSEPGWQQFKPSAIPQADARVKTASNGDYAAMAREAREGGDTALWLSVLKRAAETEGSCESLCAWADALIEVSRAEASVLEKGDFFDAARRAWDRALARDPRHVGALLGKGRYMTMMAYRGGEDPAAGMELLESALAAGADGRARAEAEFYLGMGYRRLGDESRALAQFEKALLADPAFMPAIMASRV